MCIQILYDEKPSFDRTIFDKLVPSNGFPHPFLSDISIYYTILK